MKKKKKKLKIKIYSDSKNISDDLKIEFNGCNCFHRAS